MTLSILLLLGYVLLCLLIIGFVGFNERP